LARHGGRLVLLLLLALAACTVGPDYRRPELAVPSAWSEPAPGAPLEGAAEPGAWWARFGDAQLTALVERAVQSNLELRIAEARIREARALERVAGSDLWPQIGAVAVGNATTGSATDLFLGALDLFWEIDVFGGIRRATEAARDDTEASIEERRAVLLALLGAVAINYVELRGFQSQSATVRRNLAAQEETRDLTEARARVGLASDLDVERARAQVTATAADLPLLDAGARLRMHRLAVLLGAQPAALLAELGAEAPIPSAPAELPVGVPADLLRRRPDLGRAERELAASTARIGQAKADYYPRFTLTGSIGLRSDDLTDLFSGKGAFTSFGPDVIWPIFTAGRIRANVEVQSEREAQALARYELTLLEALEDVENSLVRHAREQVRRVALRDTVEANREAAELARLLHANGLTEFLDVLVAERALLESESRLVESETAVSTSLVALYVALGGGWERAAARPVR
jgi:NodT family efflux transporter outer membrane factor (OMF) lipoprotein